jgi:hypothetical protein
MAGKAIRIVGAVLVAYALLVATHRGEFWPFSIYPMFSQAGNPWTRSLVREVPRGTDPDTVDWGTVPLEEVPGSAYPLAPRGINQNDVANYVSKTEQWTDKRIRGLRSLFAKNRELSNPLLVLKMRGKLRGGEVTVTATPMLLFTPDRSFLRPSLSKKRDRTSETSSES